MASMGDMENAEQAAHAEVEAASGTGWRRRLKPENEIPTAVAVNAVLGSTDDVVVFIPWMTVYRNGVEFRLEVRARPGHLFADRSPSEPDGSGLFEAMYQHDDVNRGNRLLLGVEFADGRSCPNLGSKELSGADAGPEHPSLWQGDCSGDNSSASASWFLTPLPPPGDLRLVCAWIAAGVAETVTTLSANDIVDAAGRARELWPVEPDPPAMALPDSPIQQVGGLPHVW